MRERTTLDSRLRDYSDRARISATGRGFGSPLRNDHVSRLRRPHVVYRDRPDMIRHVPHHVHTYWDRHDRICHRIIWPRYYYPVYYSWGPHAVFRCVYPYYHRKYVFVSLGGYWPFGYSYVRYYWYGWHPYAWYGYYPVPREIPYETNNYYTYNYYTGDGGSVASDAAYADHTTFADVRERLAQQNQQPAEQTLADTRFEEGVKSFESGDYGTAAAKFAVAMKLSPEDVILPFAYAQALFAGGQYSAAAQALREALKTVSPEKEGVFYPRGLYPDDDVLFGQIETLLDKVERFGYDGDLQLLLGYHLLGVGETDYARGPLEQAGKDMENAEAAGTLLKLLEKMEADAITSTPAATPQTSAAAPVQSEGRTKTDVLHRLSTNADAAVETDVPQEGTSNAVVVEETKAGLATADALVETGESSGPVTSLGSASTTASEAKTNAQTSMVTTEPQAAKKED